MSFKSWRRKLRPRFEQLETRQCLASMPLLWMEDNSFSRGNQLPDDFIKRFDDPQTWQVALRTIDTLYLNEDSIRNSANNINTAFIRDRMVPVLNSAQANVAIDTHAADFLGRRTSGSATNIDQALASHFTWLDSLISAGLRVNVVSLRGVLSDTVPGDTNWFGYSLSNRVTDVVEYTRRVSQRYPWMRVGIIDDLPTQGLDYATAYPTLRDALRAQGLSLDHLHLDMPVNLIGTGQRYTWDDIFQFQRYVQTTVGTRFGLMLTSQEGGEFSNHRWAQRIMAGLVEYQTAIRRLSTADTQPDRIIVTSRYTYPNTSVPELVPTPVVDGLGDVRLRNTTQSIVQLSNLLRDYDDFSESKLQNELIHVPPVAAAASSTANSSSVARRSAVDAVMARGIIDASDSLPQFQWQASSGDNTPWLKASLPKRMGIDRLRLWPYRGSNPTEGGALADIYVSRSASDVSLADNPQSNPGNWSLVQTADLRSSSDEYVETRFSLTQTPAIAIVFRNAQGQAGLAGMRVYAAVPGWINPYQSPLSAIVPTVTVQTYYVTEGLTNQLVADLSINGVSAAQDYLLTTSDARFVFSGNRLSLAPNTVLNRSATPSIAVWVKLEGRANPSFSFSKLVTFIVYPNNGQQPNLDFGDAPASFDSATHAVSSLWLGRSVDTDSTSQATINADGDDKDSDGNDDDGITMLTSLRRTTEPYSGSFLVNANGAGFVDAWFDFNSNGRFEHPQEHFAQGTSGAVTTGFSTLPLTIPAGLTAAGRIAARFRLSPTGNLTPGGLAGGGEVEDYYLVVDADTPTPRWCVQFPNITVSITLEITVTLQSTIVRDQSGELLNYGNQANAPLDVIAGPLDDTLQIHALPAQREMTLQGGLGVDKVDFTQANGVLDFTRGLVKTDSVEVLSTVNGTAQSIQFGNELPFMSAGSAGSWQIQSDANDQLQFGPAWRTQAPAWVSTGLRHRLSNGAQQVWLQNPTLWTNPLSSNDVNADGYTTPLDALLVINAINTRQALRAPTSGADIVGWMYLDPNRSSSVEPIDALLVINAINQRA